MRRADSSTEETSRDIHRGELWIDAFKNEPALRPRILAVLTSFLNDSYRDKRDLAVHIAEHVGGGDVEAALADAFIVSPTAFVGVKSAGL